MNHKTQPSAIRDLFFEAWRALSHDGENVQFKQDQEPVDTGILCLYCRISTHLRAIETLYQDDLALEAEVLLRGCLESVFWMGALINDPDSVSDMENEFNFQRQTMAGNLLRADPEIVKLSEDERAHMEAVQAEKKIKKSTSIFKIAKRAEMTEMYLKFSQLSNSAAHASLHSLNRHMVPNADKYPDYFTVLVTDPNWDKIFHLACCIVIFTKNFFNRRFSSPGRTWENGLWERLQKMKKVEKPLETS